MLNLLKFTLSKSIICCCLIYFLLPKLNLCIYQCKNGWYGSDCSIPSVLSSVREWPRWLRPARVDVPDNADLTASLVNLNAVVKKKRPLIYVYDLPPEFNSLLLEVSINISYN